MDSQNQRPLKLDSLDSIVLRIGILGVAIGMLGIQLSHDISWVRFFDNVHWTVATSSSGMLVWISYKQSPSENSTAKLWFMLGLVSYAIGQLLWDIQIFFNYNGFPAPSDIFYLMLGPCITLGFLKEVRSKVSTAEARSAWQDSILLSIAIITLVLVIYLPKRGNTELFPLVILIAYPVTLLTATGTALISALTLRTRFSRSLFLSLSGLIATALSWMHWNFLALDGITIDGSWFNISFSIAVLITGVGFSQLRMEDRGNFRFDRQCAGILRLLPLMAVIIAAISVILIKSSNSLPPLVQNLAEVGAIVVVTLALVRQSSLLKERDQLLLTRKTLDEAQSKLNFEREILKTLVSTIPDLIWLKDTEGVYLSCNPTFERMYGAKEHEIIGRTDYDFVDKDLADFFRMNDKIAMEANKSCVNDEWLTFANDGYHGLFETIKTPMQDANGKLIGVIGVARDITARNQAEEDTRIAATVFESQEGMMVTDANRLIVKVNATFTSMTGYSFDEVKGKNPHLLSSGQHDDAFFTLMWKQINETGVWKGEVWNRRKCGEIYPQQLTITTVRNPQNIIVNYVGTMMDISDRKASESKIQSLAFFDPLTKLPNRRLMLERINHALTASSRTGQHGALLFLDLDHFKTLNDTLGHNLGDLLLQQAAERLTNCLRETDTAARIGGDEFVVLLEDLSDQELEAATQAEVAGHKILAALKMPYDLDTQSYNSSTSIGITLFCKTHLEADDLLKKADIAMYQAKSAGRNALRFFEAEMQIAINNRAELERLLSVAIKQQQFELYYQIQVDQTGQALGAEALIRWHHPTRGLVSPLEFIPAAEEIGLILPIGQWVIETACAQLQAWQKNSLTQSLTISINVSSKQFSQQSFVEQVKAIVANYGINPKLLNLELTESLFLNDVEDTVNTMNALQAIGIRFELDDFGTGYSSLQYLKKLPLYQLKIDRTFVSDISRSGSDQAIVRTIIAMAKSLTLEVIAEGVETEQQRERLLHKGCTRYQGYLFSRPIPIDDFESLLRRN
jgi:diguanylate cyclase (GGDEF)-like protein/PAS domain S-box-containing protein